MSEKLLSCPLEKSKNGYFSFILKRVDAFLGVEPFDPKSCEFEIMGFCEHSSSGGSLSRKICCKTKRDVESTYRRKVPYEDS